MFPNRYLNVQIISTLLKQIDQYKMMRQENKMRRLYVTVNS